MSSKDEHGPDLNGDETPEFVLIEDDDDFATLVKLEAESRGVKLTHYRDASTAMKNLNKSAKGYLVDWDLPGTDGIEFLENLSQEQREKMVLMSSLVLPEVKAKAKKMGFTKYVDKPEAFGRLFDLLGDQEEETSTGDSPVG